jgi:hypothetical protein
MFVLTAKVWRNGSLCREYYQPEETGFVPGVVFGLDGAKRAKQYQTEEEAIADIPVFRRAVGYHDQQGVDVVAV